jgi:uncharacterized protein (TIGR03437 family)
VPVEVPVAAAAPGLFTLNQQGTGQAAALLAGTATLVAPATPAARGSVVELYGSGFGPVSNPPADGEKASLTTLSHVVTPVQATIDGKPAQILFAGLTPGAVGLYQINLLIPEDAAIGDQVEVVLRQGNVSSNPVTIAIR